MSPRIDLIAHGPATDLSWPLGDVVHTEPTPAALAAALIVDRQRTDASAVLAWNTARPLPPADLLRHLVGEPVDVWHAGLCLGTASLPRLLDHARPTWPHNRDPAPDIRATSWRMDLGCSLIRQRVLNTLGGPDARYETLLGAALDLGHRYLRSGALIIHEPALLEAPQRSTPPLSRPRFHTSAFTASERARLELPLADEVRFLRNRFGERWALWALGRHMLHSRRRLGEVRRAWAATHATTIEPPHRLPPRPRLTQPSAGDVIVLIPTLDRYEHLEILLRQLPLQTVAPKEVVVVDQTPLERRRELPGGLDLCVRLLRLETPGQCSSRNLGIRASDSRYILFLDDDDDQLPADLIERHLANLETYGADASCGVTDEVGAGPLPPEFHYFRISDVLPTNNCMIRRSSLQRSGLFDLAYEHGARADADLGLRLYLTGALVLLDPEISLLHRRAPTGGLRTWGARRQTYAAARRSVWRQHLPSTTEIYLARRHFSTERTREAMWIAAFGTLSGHGSAVHRILKASIGLLTMPVTVVRLARRQRAAERMLESFPQIPDLDVAEGGEAVP